ncbi:hypothetical protein Vretifemale_230 [Volvox reticuliferus]|uniref:Uncharacterized protein n=2 Tax=Volvox reticuliferus TaxID=1737510 RepID=A0A8J4C0W8_9CHLO|nr:hypothetical protein Vretifemale_230 [Volvox reticuliferus]
MLQLPQPHALGMVFGGFFLGTKKHQKKGLKEDHKLNLHPQLSRLVERGKEDVSLATAELLPSPMANHRLQQTLPMRRRSVEEHYELPDNLRVTSTDDTTAHSDALRAELPFAPAPSGRGPIVMLSPLSHTEDDQPLSASSDCSSADGSGSPSTRNNSFFSFANGAHNALSGSSTSASSSRSESACGSTEDTATSVEAPNGSGFPDVLELPTCCTRVVDMPYQFSLVAQPQPQPLDCMEVSAKRPSQLFFPYTSNSAISAASVNRAQSQVGSVAALASPSLLLQDIRQCGAACELKCEDAPDGFGIGGEGGLAMSRSSSLALSFADYVHHDSLLEADLLLGEQQHAADRQDASTGGTQQQQQQYGQGQTAAAHRKAGTDTVDDTFSFTPVGVLQLLNNAKNSACIRTCDVEETAYPGAGCDRSAHGCTEPNSFRFGPVCSSGLPAHTVTLRQAETSSDNTGVECVRWAESISAPSRTGVQQQGQHNSLHVMNDCPQQCYSMPARLISPVAEPQGDGNAVSTSCPMPVCTTKTPAAMDLKAVDSTLQLLKQLRGSLLATRVGSGVSRHQICKTSIDSSDGEANGSGRVLAMQPEHAIELGGPSTISQSLAQAAQKLLGLGLLPGPLKNGEGGLTVQLAQPLCGATAPPLCSAVPLADPSSESACSSGSTTQGVDVTFGKHVSAGGAAAATVYHQEQGAAGAAGHDGTSSCNVPSKAPNDAPEPCEAQISRPRRRTALLKRMQADWARIQERVAAMVEDYSALAKCVAAAVSKQLALERHCTALERGKALVTRQMHQEREQREALGRELEQVRAQHEALALQLEREQDVREILERQMQQEHVQREGLVQQLERASAKEQELYAGTATLQLEMDELLLCLGQESTKVALLAEALRVAGGDPDAIIEQVESEFAVKEVAPI